ncbi:hypothetical protein DPMN_105255 [Dreissena polymorpha]|uniref:Uncharacterized protein n=1 Tax=Dreissena polymorpha TaxID=45954 RepID=A0A9D4K1Q1_DREPO|nr:hypothetical protein DPMN_105255 [Dreissena polymorpha]
MSDFVDGYVSRFQKYLAKKGETKAIHNLSVDHLDAYLATYLLSIRKNDDDEYEPVTLRSIVGSIDVNFKEQITRVDTLRRRERLHWP